MYTDQDLNSKQNNRCTTTHLSAADSRFVYSCSCYLIMPPAVFLAKILMYIFFKFTKSILDIILIFHILKNHIFMMPPFKWTFDSLPKIFDIIVF